MDAAANQAMPLDESGDQPAKRVSTSWSSSRNKGEYEYWGKYALSLRQQTASLQTFEQNAPTDSITPPG